MKKVGKELKIELVQECPKCEGTGLYIGMAEGEGYAVQCHNCKGSGRQLFVHKYREFKGRKLRSGIKRVLEFNPGIAVGGDGDFGGLSYEEWLDGEPFKDGTEMREYTCPAWWYQGTSNMPDWCPDLLVGNRFYDCKRFVEKDKCWEGWDELRTSV